jgi:uncharacterized OB-fold protein
MFTIDNCRKTAELFLPAQNVCPAVFQKNSTFGCFPTMLVIEELKKVS